MYSSLSAKLFCLDCPKIVFFFWTPQTAHPKPVLFSHTITSLKIKSKICRTHLRKKVSNRCELHRATYLPTVYSHLRSKICSRIQQQNQVAKPWKLSFVKGMFLVKEFMFTNGSCLWRRPCFPRNDSSPLSISSGKDSSKLTTLDPIISCNFMITT